MKKAQSIVEYFIVTVVMLFIAMAVLWNFNFSDLAPISVFGARSNSNSVAIPPMTP